MIVDWCVLFIDLFAVHQAPYHIDNDHGNDEQEKRDTDHDWNSDADEVTATLDHCNDTNFYTTYCN